MDSISYSMVNKQLNSLKNLEIVTNNVANTNSAGYREDTLIFDQYLVRDAQGKTSYPQLLATVSKFDEGSVKTTYRTLDVAIKGDGFFLLQTPQGIRYTRNGNFHINNENKLTNSQGYPVLSSDGQEIVFEDGDGAPIIGDDGSIFIGTNQRGQIGVAEFENHKLLRKLGNGLFASDIAGKASEDYQVLQGVLEESNVNSITQMGLLIELNREAAMATNMLNEYYGQQRNTYKSLAKLGGN